MSGFSQITPKQHHPVPVPVAGAVAQHLDRIQRGVVQTGVKIRLYC